MIKGLDSVSYYLLVWDMETMVGVVERCYQVHGLICIGTTHKSSLNLDTVVFSFEVTGQATWKCFLGLKGVRHIS